MAVGGTWPVSALGQWGKCVGVTGSGQSPGAGRMVPAAQLQPTADIAEHAQLPCFCFLKFY